MMPYRPTPLNLMGRIALSCIRATPLCRGKARKLILAVIKRHINHPIITDFRGIPFVFNLDNPTEEKALFGWYNIQELNFLKEKASRPGSVFVDLGANSGFYTQNFLGSGGSRLALAIEPNPAMCTRIKANYDLLQTTKPDPGRQFVLECCAVGEYAGQAELDLSQGLGSASITGHKTNQTITVRTEPLLSILGKHNIRKIDVLKVDIEGYEDKALVPFFNTADPALFPTNIIIEHTASHIWAHDLFSIMTKKGYITVGKTRGNLLLTRT